MKKTFLCTLILGIFLTGCDWNDDEGLFSCTDGDGPVITQELILEEFTRLKLRTSGDVFLSQGETQKIEVEGQQNIIHQLDLDVNDDTWEIEFDDCVKDYEPLKFYITLQDISELNISGSGTIYGENTFDIDHLKLRISGSGDMDIALENADKIDAKISGSGRIKLAGATEDFELNISGSGDYRCFNLEAQDGIVDISGSGDAEVNTNDELIIDISGSGDVYYIGDPDLNINISGSGDVIDAN